MCERVEPGSVEGRRVATSAVGWTPYFALCTGIVVDNYVHHGAHRMPVTGSKKGVAVTNDMKSFEFRGGRECRLSWAWHSLTDVVYDSLSLTMF